MATHKKVGKTASKTVRTKGKAKKARSAAGSALAQRKKRKVGKKK